MHCVASWNKQDFWYRIKPYLIAYCKYFTFQGTILSTTTLWCQHGRLPFVEILELLESNRARSDCGWPARLYNLWVDMVCWLITRLIPDSFLLWLLDCSVIDCSSCVTATYFPYFWLVGAEVTMAMKEEEPANAIVKCSITLTSPVCSNSSATWFKRNAFLSRLTGLVAQLMSNCGLLVYYAIDSR